MRGGGKHKDKKSKAEKKQVASAKTPEQKFTDQEKGDRGPAIRGCDKDAAIQMTEDTDGYRKIVRWAWADENTEEEGNQEEVREECGEEEKGETRGMR